MKKLVLYDEKHQRIDATLEIRDESQVLAVIKFLEENLITNRYRKLALVNDAVVKYEEGEPFIEFS